MLCLLRIQSLPDNMGSAHMISVKYIEICLLPRLMYLRCCVQCTAWKSSSKTLYLALTAMYRYSCFLRHLDSHRSFVFKPSSSLLCAHTKKLIYKFGRVNNSLSGSMDGNRFYLEV